MTLLKKLMLALAISSCSLMAFANGDIEQIVNNPKNFRAEAEKAYMEQRYTDAFKWYERYSNLGDGQSSYNVAFMLQYGQGTKQDYKKALKYYKKASNLNFSMADMALANIYAFGHMGVKVDLAQAKYYLERASKQGTDSATLELANLYFNENTDESTQKALELLQPLINANHADAIYLKAVYDLGIGLTSANQKIVMQSVNHLENLTKQGHIQSMMAVAYMLTQGEVVPQNLPLAHNLYSILVENNVPTAKERLAEVEQLMQSVR